MSELSPWLSGLTLHADLTKASNLNANLTETSSLGVDLAGLELGVTGTEYKTDVKMTSYRFHYNK